MSLSSREKGGGGEKGRRDGPASFINTVTKPAIAVEVPFVVRSKKGIGKERVIAREEKKKKKKTASTMINKSTFNLPQTAYG